MKNLTVCVLILLILSSCNGRREQEFKKAPEISEDQIINMNRYLLEKDNELIEAYAKRRGMEMKRSGTGLWYLVDGIGNDNRAEKGNTVTINYDLELLDGTLCYSSDTLGPKTFVIGKGQVEQGLEEGMLLMCEGDKATFILPPHLGHHLLGDENKIPSRAILVYRVELLKISTN